MRSDLKAAPEILLHLSICFLPERSITTIAFTAYNCRNLGSR